MPRQVAGTATAGGRRTEDTGCASPSSLSAAAELRGDAPVLVDLTGVTLCDSSGLSALLVVHRCAGAIRLTGVGPQLQRMLDRTGLSELLAVAHSDDDVGAIG
ncbi:anti-anti-sigma factor [Micromonospora inaquosa]|uniref:Anti-anti-sigma factor n=1 Tax=Micromonospora inaquosa TaxID=2203716 RepID=A0A3N9WTZ5_9ACTN|nr:anti-anti-sigma factor [Micromonospora inaquosa]